jgi:hypothetical protein
MPTRRCFLSAIVSLCAAAGLSRLAGGAAGDAPAPAKVNGGAWVPRIGDPRPSGEGWRLAVLQSMSFEPDPVNPLQGTVTSRYVLLRCDERGRVVEVRHELPEAP